MLNPSDDEQQCAMAHRFMSVISFKSLYYVWACVCVLFISFEMGFLLHYSF